MNKDIIELALRKARHELMVCGNEDAELQREIRDALRELHKED